MRISDWSSDVCSSDLSRFLCEDAGARAVSEGRYRHPRDDRPGAHRRLSARRHRLGRGRLAVVAADPSRLERDRKSVVEGKRVSVRVYLGGGRIIKKTKNT